MAGLARGQLNAPSKDVFDQARWDAATERVQAAYRNEGYLYARVTPIVERIYRLTFGPVIKRGWVRE